MIMNMIQLYKCEKSRKSPSLVNYTLLPLILLGWLLLSIFSDFEQVKKLIYFAGFEQVKKLTAKLSLEKPDAYALFD